MGMAIWRIDAFTDRPFAGNPAGVMILDQPADPAWMQDVALEMNLSETAFLWPEEDGFRLRWFTPTVEVELCGHATVASAHLLFESGRLRPDDRATFYTLSGPLYAVREADGGLSVDFPAEPESPADPPSILAESLGVTPRYVGKNRFDYLVEVESEAFVRSLRPDFNLMAALPVRGVIATARSASPEYDFVSRFFAPAAGVNEDPVTGSAHCCLGPFWKKRLKKNELVGYQASRRGGTVRVRVGEGRVTIGGRAVTVIRGEFL